ncbi:MULTISPECIES: helix-turn-helix domain-containing protein [Bacteroidota]|uniref:helix-turn-helix domain-containing protein n=1 Tax=Bacteroidota TaxID=976 RepID=UPI001CBEF8BA|nr:MULTISPECIES: helix-turn-helix transcriptional regulator [Bacteroidota]MBZ4190753.1 helix-turn-helix domain-containing protein [Niabella beijingensis]UMQ40855.1 helix-turn-helix domain-containing protein [Chryseobacterium sp. Y16C]
MEKEKDTVYMEGNKHMGIKIGSARRLVGITQKDLADRMGVTKQAVSKLEQTENVDDERLEKVAIALGVSIEGLKKFDVGQVLYHTNNFYEKVEPTNGAMVGTVTIEHNHQFSIEQATKLFEELLKMERQHFQNAQGNK